MLKLVPSAMQRGYQRAHHYHGPSYPNQKDKARFKTLAVLISLDAFIKDLMIEREESKAMLREAFVTLRFRVNSYRGLKRKRYIKRMTAIRHEANALEKRANKILMEEIYACLEGK
jgi:hypothetical protein